MALTNKQQAFVNEYLQCWNASEAARRAGYSLDTAYSIGQENLKKPEVAAEIQARVAEMTMGADEALIRLGDMARVSIEDFTDIHDGLNHGVYLNFNKARERGKLHLIKKLKYNAIGYPEIELHDAQAALIQIAKHHGLFNQDESNQTVVNTSINFIRQGTSTLPEHLAPGSASGTTGEEAL